MKEKLMYRRMLSAIILVIICACTDSEEEGVASGPGGAGVGNGDVSAASTEGQTNAQKKTCREAMTSYTGLGAKVLVAGRLDGEQDEQHNPVVLDRHRVKPFQVLADDLHRILGTTQPSMDALLATSADTFAASPPRWFIEPQSSAVTLFTTYRIAFRGCVQFAKSEAAWSVQPTAAAAATACAKLQAKAWSTTPSKAEIDACVAIATDEAEFAKATPSPVTDAKTKWAYACASIFESNKFTSF
jgi:hypothetical protein